MEDKFERIVVLFKKSYCGELLEQERAELTELLRDASLKEVYDRLNSGKHVYSALSEYERYPYDKAFHHFQQAVRKPEQMSWYLKVASIAASVLIAFLLIGVSGDFRWINDFQKVTANNVIEAGTKKAQIRLADGSVVNMTKDTMQVQDKSGTMIAYNNGKITYEHAEKVEALVYNELLVPLAGECYIVLDDGTKVWMNSDSRLRYPVRFVGDERRVFLEGEAYFEVMKDSKPFVVETVLGNVNVLGTSFDVKAYKDEECVYTTLVTGKVRFSGKQVVDIVQGEQVVASRSGVVEKRNVDVAEYVGWKDGLYVFKKQSLECIMTTLSRWYGVTVFYQNPEAKRVDFTGNLKRYDSINTFMEVLARTGDVKYRIKGNTITLFQ